MVGTRFPAVRGSTTTDSTSGAAASILAALHVAVSLTQAQISLDWLGLTSRMYAAAAEIAGEISEGRWDAPP